MVDEPSRTPDTGKPNYSPALPQQIRDQLAVAEQIRADIELVNEADNVAAAAAAPEPAPAAQPQQPEESWEQRARTMAGRAEQLTKTNQALSERMQALERQIAAAQVKGTPEPAPGPKPKPKLVTPEEERDYGQDFLQVVGKRAKEEFAPEFDDLADRLRRLEGRIEGVGQVIEKTQVNDVYGNLKNAVSNWRDINRSTEFKQWLERPDMYSGRKRHDMLLEAFSRHDSPRVVAFFKGFLTEATGSPSNSPGPAPSAPPLPSGNGSGRPTLEDFAAPGGARSAPQQLPPDKPVYTAAWIAKFTQDKLRGAYRGREADANAIEQDIWQAQHEGRIH